ncbi:S8 family serine peptidase [uncultured Clostridium sp.]|uniref:S8 family serine peptidase n=1 Tax=uncultured Clostridium sp. TaxID=59620 RepID=UPI0026070456|nr:S8 family serine peptidase [uncultured Clostridium sp.]
MKGEWLINYNKLDGKLNFINEIKNRNLAGKINFFKQVNTKDAQQIIEVVGISGDNVDKISQSMDKIGGKYENLGYGYGIIQISVDKIDELKTLETFQYLELPKTLYTSDFYSNRSICVNEIQETYDLYGEGVLAGFVDTGIDYKHPGFKNEDGTTRIEYIWDLELNKIYNKEQINLALKSDDPDSIVKSYDLIQHGTHVAGIVCAGGKIPKDKYGIASKSSIMMVKATRGKFSISTEIMRGLKFLVDKSKELKMPLVVNLSLSTNDGAHNGRSLLEKYIQTVCELERITIVVAAGNEGSASHHVGGDLRIEQSIDFNIAEGEESITLSMYFDILTEIAIEVINPTGKTTGFLILKEGYNEFVIDGDKILFYVSGAKPFDLTGEILLSIVGAKGNVLNGKWTFKIKNLNNSKGKYNIWLPIQEGLNPETKFLEPNPFFTIGIPATVRNVISVGSYNNIMNNISSFSGRGELFLSSDVKPELIAPGENVLSLIPDGFDTKTGTSMASPHVAGVTILFTEWGIVKNNDRFLFGERIKNYLIKGAKRDRPDEVYPNSIWGYGVVCASKAFEILLGESNMRGEKRMYRARKIVEYYGEIEKVLAKYKETTLLILDERTAVIEAPYDDMEDILKNVKEIVYVESSPVYTLNRISPVEASGAYLFNNNPYLSLTGRDVIVGIIDTGIDYLNGEFINEDNTTRIVSMWDQTVKGEKIGWRDYGKVYSEEVINNALMTKTQGKDPYTIVESKDENGHGTMVAGIIGARGKDPNLIGAAPECLFTIVKLKEASKNYLDEAGVLGESTGRYENADILLGIRHILDVAREKLKPAVLYIPLGTNIGSHDGKTIIERYIDDLSKRRGVVVVASTGNEGNEDTHTEGILKESGDTKTIELMVDKNQSKLNFEIWFRKPDKVSLGIVSPSGEVIEKMPAKLKQVEEIKFVFERTKMFIQYLIPEEITGDEVIRIQATDLKEGIWQFKLVGDYIVDGRYDSWLPQRSLIAAGTKFLNSSQYCTLEMPSTSGNAIVAGYYNQNNTATVSKSGRGYTRDGRVKPDIVAGGIDAVTITPGGGTQVSSGASIGGAVLAGCAALLMQWGIVDGNDPTMYSVKMKTYLIRGAKMRVGDTYPNKEWGYGMIDMKGVFDSIRAEKYRDMFTMYDVDGLYVRKPKN